MSATAVRAPEATLGDLPAGPAWLGFLADEERVDHRPDRLIDLVRQKLAEAEYWADQLGAANLTALLLFRLGRLDEARAFCREEIGHALRYAASPGSRHLAVLAVQPQINLLRIEGFAGDLEACLTGLTGLEDMIAGRPARFPDLELDARVVSGPRAVVWTQVARSMRVHVTSTVLWRRGRPTELLAETDRWVRMWPCLAFEGGCQHAAEARWLLGRTRRERAPERLPDLPPLARQLSWIRLLQAAAHEAAEDPVRAHDLVVRLYEQRHEPITQYASALTPLRRQAHLADTLLRVGRADLAGPLLEEIAADPQAHAEPSFVRGIAARLVAAGRSPAELPPTPDPVPDGAVDDLVALVLDRLRSL